MGVSILNSRLRVPFQASFSFHTARSTTLSFFLNRFTSRLRRTQDLGFLRQCLLLLIRSILRINGLLVSIQNNLVALRTIVLALFKETLQAFGVNDMNTVLHCDFLSLLVTLLFDLIPQIVNQRCIVVRKTDSTFLKVLFKRKNIDVCLLHFECHG